MAKLLKVEEDILVGRNKMLELIRVPRNRRAMLASEIVMFMVRFLVFKWMPANYFVATILRRKCNRHVYPFHSIFDTSWCGV
jgi:hypothetical protein